MSTQIAVRLPDELVSYVDELVKDGGGSRARVVAQALQFYQRQVRAEQDARILEELGDYEDFADLPQYGAVSD